MATRRGFLFACAGLTACGCGEPTNRPKTVDKNCPACNGSGRKTGPRAICRGSGTGVGELSRPGKCGSCGGSGSVAMQCSACSGTGKVLDSR